MVRHRRVFRSVLRIPTVSATERDGLSAGGSRIRTDGASRDALHFETVFFLYNCFHIAKRLRPPYRDREGSNPASSSGESFANLKMMLNRRQIEDRAVAVGDHGRGRVPRRQDHRLAGLTWRLMEGRSRSRRRRSRRTGCSAGDRAGSPARASLWRRIW